MVTMPFGKHKGEPLSSVDTGYLKWMLQKSEQPDAWDGLVYFVEDYRRDIVDEIDHRERQTMEAGAAKLTLTPHQKEVAEQVLDVLEDEGMARLEGGAGYGKSYTTAEVLIDLRRRGLPVRACATSYVATQVLRQNLSPFGFEANTIARTLKQSKVWDRDQEVYVLTDDSRGAAEYLFRGGGVLLVDEYSMVNDEIAEFLLEEARRAGGRLIAVGDLKQLPPVKQETPSIFATEVPAGGTLKIPMRYSMDSVLYQVEQTARKNPWTLNPREFESSEVQVHKTREQTMRAYLESLQANRDWSHRALFFRRSDVVGANNWIRIMMHGDAAQNPVVEDEQLMVLATTDYRSAEGERYYSGTTFRALGYRRGVKEIRIGSEVVSVPCNLVHLETGHEVAVVFALSETVADNTRWGSEEYTKLVIKAREYAKQAREDGLSESDAWAPYRLVQESFLKVGYSYATTLHRAQGGSLDVVMVDPWSIPKAGGSLLRDALAYVGLTRAKKQLILPDRH